MITSFAVGALVPVIIAVVRYRWDLRKGIKALGAELDTTGIGGQRDG